MSYNGQSCACIGSWVKKTTKTLLSRLWQAYQTSSTIIDFRFIFISVVHGGVDIKDASKGRKAVISFCYLCLAIINRIKRVQCLTMAKAVLALVLGLKRLQHYCQGYDRFYQTKFTIIDMRFISISLVHSGLVIKNASKGRKAVISWATCVLQQ